RAWSVRPPVAPLVFVVVVSTLRCVVLACGEQPTRATPVRAAAIPIRVMESPPGESRGPTWAACVKFIAPWTMKKQRPAAPGVRRAVRSSGHATLYGIDASPSQPAEDQRQHGEDQEDEEEDAGAFPSDPRHQAEARQGGEDGDDEEHDGKP